MQTRYLLFATLVVGHPLVDECIHILPAPTAAAHEPIAVRSLPSTSRVPTKRETLVLSAGTGRQGPVDDAIRLTLRTSEEHLERKVQEALSLVAKGATHSANARLIEVLELTAAQLDQEIGVAVHAAALAAGLKALSEAEDFRRNRWGEGNARVNWRELGHTTPVLQERTQAPATRTEAMELYYSYASRQLTQAVYGSKIGSQALYHLGRLQPFLVDETDGGETLIAARTVALYRASLEADSSNFRAANELGVMLARRGQLEYAKIALIRSAEVGLRPETIANLGIVFRQLGDERKSQTLLELARDRRRQDQQLHTGSAVGQTLTLVRWVEPQQFSLPEPHAANPVVPGAGKEIVVEPADSTERRSFPRFRFGWPTSAEKRKSGKRVETTSRQRAAPEDSSSSDDTNWARFMNYGRTAAPPPGEIQQVQMDESEPEIEEEIAEVPPIAFSPDRSYGFPDGTSRFENGIFTEGEYLGPPRTPHVPEYYLRIEDSLGFVYRLNGRPSATPYRLNVGDVIRITSLTADNLSLETLVQPDGTIVLPQVGSVMAAGKTIDALRQELDARFQEFLREPTISIAPVTINKTVEELRNSIVMRTGLYNGQMFSGKVAPDGTIQLPAIGSVPALGLSLNELRSEVELRYAKIGSGIEVTPVLQQRAPHYVFVLGEVGHPGRVELTGPTTAIQAISLAGGWNKGGNVKEVIVFRRDAYWRLMATRLNVRPALYNKPDLCAEDIWLRDSDIIIVPKLPIQVCDDWIELIFTRGIYGVVPFNGVSFSFFKDLSTLGMAN